MDKFQRLLKDQLLQIDSIYSLYTRQLGELHDIGNVSLRRSGKKNGNHYYYKCDPESGKRKYLGTDSNQEVILIKKVRFCKELSARAEKDKLLLKRLIDEYYPLDYDAINESLPCTYRDAEIIFDKHPRLDKRAEEWKKSKEAVKKSVPIIYPEGLKHTAIDGTRVRSKSELTIANMLFTNNVPYIYECPYFFDGEILRFDFTALSTVDYESEVVVEHQGMMDLDSYRGKYMHTLMTCLGNELVPNVDIFFTFEDLDGNFDSRQIWDIIRTRLIQINR